MISRRRPRFRQRNSRQPVRFRPAIGALIVVGGLAACGGSDAASDNDPSSLNEAGATATDAAVDQPDEQPDAGPDGEQSMAGTGTLNLADGTAYAFVMTTCETSENGSDGLTLPDTYDLFGKTADGAYSMQLIRAGIEEYIAETASLEGDFDDEGKNAGILYTKVVDTLALTVDGGHVSGTVTFSPIGPNRPHGDEVKATVDVTC